MNTHTTKKAFSLFLMLTLCFTLLFIVGCKNSTANKTAPDFFPPAQSQEEPSPDQSIPNDSDTTPEKTETTTPSMPPGVPQQLETSTITLTTVQGEFTYTVQVADEDPEWRKGLMFVEHLPEEEGMIFLFPRASTQAFWMKNTLIPLDIIFIDESWSVINVAQAEPCEQDPCVSYYSSRPAKYVLELAQGQAKIINLLPGDDVILLETRTQPSS